MDGVEQTTGRTGVLSVSSKDLGGDGRCEVRESERETGVEPVMADSREDSGADSTPSSNTGFSAPDDGW